MCPYKAEDILIPDDLHHMSPTISKVKNRITDSYLVQYAQELYKRYLHLDSKIEVLRQKLIDDARPITQQEQAKGDKSSDGDNSDQEVLFKLKEVRSYQDKHGVKARIDTGSRARMHKLKQAFAHSRKQLMKPVLTNNENDTNDVLSFTSLDENNLRISQP